MQGFSVPAREAPQATGTLANPTAQASGRPPPPAALLPLGDRADRKRSPPWVLKLRLRSAIPRSTGHGVCSAREEL